MRELRRLAIGPIALVAIICLGSCAPKGNSPPVHDDTTALRMQLGALAKENDELRSKLVDQANLIASLRKQQADAVGFTQPAGSTVKVTASETEWRAGGLTDLGQSHEATAATDPAADRYETSSRQQPTVVIIGQEASSGSSTAGGPSIDQRCREKWQTNYEMVAYCEKNQRDALATLEKGDIYHVGPSAFREIENQCRAKWGRDYEMVVYCEKQQADAYNSLQR